VATLLFLGASVSQLPAIERARELGHRVVAVDGDAKAVAFPLCDATAAVDFSDVDAVAEVGARHRVDGVLAISSDRAVLPAARIAEALGLPGVGVEVARAMTDKAVMRAALSAAGLRQPRFAIVHRPADAHRTLELVPLPVVVKPADSGGQRGVRLVERREELAGAIGDAASFSRSGTVVVESFVPGPELNGIFVVRDGEPLPITLSDRLRPAGRGFGVGWAHLYPSRLAPDALAAASSLGADAIRALGLRNGIAFPQLIVGTDGRPQLVEAAARIPAGQMADLVRCATGIDLFELAIAFALGEEIPDARVAHLTRRPIAIRFLTADPGPLPVGVIDRVDGLDAVRASDGVLAAGFYVGPGARIRPVEVDADRNGYVVATGTDALDALARADAAAAKLRVTVRPPARAWRMRELLAPLFG
jgi:biotin carboxylase